MTTDDYLSEYTTRGFSREEAEDWSRAWFKGPAARLWCDAGFEPEEAHVWGEALFDPQGARPWREALMPLVADQAVGEHAEWRQWRAARTAAAHWRDAGFSPEEAVIWQTAGFGFQDAKVAARLRATGLGPEDAQASRSLKDH